MKAMVLKRICDLKKTADPLELVDLPEPVPKANEILVRVKACGVCHTELDEIEGRTPPPRFPVVLGHQVVGEVVGWGKCVTRFHGGERVGVGWIHSACGKCAFCLREEENLCGSFRATGRDVNGGYAEYLTVPEDYAHPIPEIFTDAEAAPLLCAGAI
ncbi:MAG TPA: alcohol dehydrogenase catalytic domain-containing protein, partial [Deltaproteobacteria bacterium]|nr:alcohol dehydrogenase catalytic domain-containing protein [Deltaproteobacteria bacterium]